MPRPLLVVHSGKTTTGRSADFKISFRDWTGPPPPKAGTQPVTRSILSRETLRNPERGTFELKTRVAGEEIAAEPVPVFRPALLVTGVDVNIASAGIDVGSGRTNIGSNLEHIVVGNSTQLVRVQDNSPEGEVEDVNPRDPVRDDEIAHCRIPGLVELKPATVS